MKTVNNLAIILTCFNRKDTTIKCIESLISQKSNVCYKIFICDDNSTDGTIEVLSKKFPQIHVIKGSGDLFWNRGMLKAWEYAKKTDRFDAYLWLNDDVKLNENALRTMIESASMSNNMAIICGAFCDSNGCFSYGGRDIDGNAIIPNGALQEICWLNGNCVLVPESVENRIGMLDKMYHHHLGDYDYGLRALESGFKIYTTPNYIGICKPNPMIHGRGRKSGLGMIDRFRFLYSPLGCNPITEIKYHFRHPKYFSRLWAIKVFIMFHVNTLLPDTLYNLIHKRNE